MSNLYFDLADLKHLGKGAIVGKCVRIRRPELANIGDHTILDDFTYISCQIEIGSYCHVASNVTISGGPSRKLTTGDFVGIAAGCTILSGSSDYLNASFELPSIPEEFHFGGTEGDIRFADHVLLGTHTVVLPGANLPEGFACAAHTVVRDREYEPWTLYAGFECRKVTKRSHRRLDETLAVFRARRHQRLEE